VPQYRSLTAVKFGLVIVPHSFSSSIERAARFWRHDDVI